VGLVLFVGFLCWVHWSKHQSVFSFIQVKVRMLGHR